MEKTYLKNFCIHRFFLFVKKSNHLNSQVCWQATNFGLQKKKKQIRKSYYFKYSLIFFTLNTGHPKLLSIPGNVFVHKPTGIK